MKFGNPVRQMFLCYGMDGYPISSILDILDIPVWDCGSLWDGVARAPGIFKKVTIFRVESKTKRTPNSPILQRNFIYRLGEINDVDTNWIPNLRPLERL